MDADGKIRRMNTAELSLYNKATSEAALRLCSQPESLHIKIVGGEMEDWQKIRAVRPLQHDITCTALETT